jgi:3-oxoacyl-[acyl-carrier-protein] synthase-3
MNKLYSIITGSGSYIPEKVIDNKDFLKSSFFDSFGEKIKKENDEIINKFQEITDIKERRYVNDNLVTSDIGCFAAKDALESSNTDKECLDYIIVAHNFGDIKHNTTKIDIVPSLASRVKAKLGIQNPFTVAYDLPFGCPGWLQAVIQADYYLKSGDAKKVLVIGAETLSRISDPHDIDSMIYSDGAGAVIMEAIESEEPIGVLGHKTRSDAIEHSQLLKMGDSFYQENGTEDKLFLKMNGRKLYEYALNTVPDLVKDCIDTVGLSIENVKKVLIHQANAKMDDAILFRLFKLFSIKRVDIPKFVMPMTISELGNNSVATLPILFDLIIKGKMENHSINSGDSFVFASVGAGMNVNAVVYKMH